MIPKVKVRLLSIKSLIYHCDGVYTGYLLLLVPNDQGKIQSSLFLIYDPSSRGAYLSIVIHRNTTKSQTWAVFIFFLLINVVSSGGHLDWRDGVEAFVVTESMVLKGSAKFHSDVPSVRELYPEIWLSKYNLFSKPTYTPRSLLLSAIAIPSAAVLFVSPVLVLGLFVNSIIIALLSFSSFQWKFMVPKE